MSPVILLLVQRLGGGQRVTGGYRDLHRLLADNRALLKDALAGSPVAVADADSKISVARVALGQSSSADAADVYEGPGTPGTERASMRPVHWARPEEGHRMLRVALDSRDGADVSAAAQGPVNRRDRQALGSAESPDR